METVAQKTEWSIDPAHSNVLFSISHFMISNVRGSFDEFQGSIVSSEEDFEDATVNLIIQTASVNTNEKDRDQHLKSADFFGAEKNPEITFKSSSFKKVSEDTYVVEGPLTMNGITKDVTMEAKYKGTFEHPQFKKTIAVFEITAEIPRLDFNVGSDYPGAALGELVKLDSTVELVKN